MSRISASEPAETVCSIVSSRMDAVFALKSRTLMWAMRSPGSVLSRTLARG